VSRTAAHTSRAESARWLLFPGRIALEQTGAVDAVLTTGESTVRLQRVVTDLCGY